MRRDRVGDHPLRGLRCRAAHESARRVAHDRRPDAAAVNPVPTSASPRIDDGADAASACKRRGGSIGIAHATRCSWTGWWSTLRHEATLRHEMALVVVVVPERIVELLSAAPEAPADAIRPQLHPLLGRAKDLTARR